MKPLTARLIAFFVTFALVTIAPKHASAQILNQGDAPAPKAGAEPQRTRHPRRVGRQRRKHEARRHRAEAFRQSAGDPEELKKQIGSDAERDVEVGRGPHTSRTIIPPYYEERSGSFSFRTVFPIWAERREPGRSRLALRSPLLQPAQHAARRRRPLSMFLEPARRRRPHDGGRPFMHREAPGEHHNWLAPLFFSGSRRGRLFAHSAAFDVHPSQREGRLQPGRSLLLFLVRRLVVQRLGRRRHRLRRASLPLRRSKRALSLRVGPSPFALFHYSEVDDSSLNVWGPFVWKHQRETDSFNVLPLFWHSWGKSEEHLTLFPFFHYGYEGTKMLLINPLFVSARGEQGESTFATWGYARYRGGTSLDMITPFYWHFEDPISAYPLAPLSFFLQLVEPARLRDDALSLFLAHQARWSQRIGVGHAAIRAQPRLSGWSTNLYPFLYLGRSEESTHTVVAPIFWDFASPKSRVTVAFPFYWRFADTTSVSQLLGNTYYHERKVGSSRDWELHIFPAFSYGETPDGHWWNVLYGWPATRAAVPTRACALCGAYHAERMNMSAWFARRPSPRTSRTRRKSSLPAEEESYKAVAVRTSRAGDEQNACHAIDQKQSIR